MLRCHYLLLLDFNARYKSYITISINFILSKPAKYKIAQCDNKIGSRLGWEIQNNKINLIVILSIKQKCQNCLERRKPQGKLWF